MTATGLMTAEDLERMAEDDGRYDLIKGVLHRMSPTGLRQLIVSGTFIRVFGAFVAERELGVVGGEGGFVLERDPDTVLAPDMVFIRGDRLPPEEELDHFAHLAPDLVVEVLSPSDTARKVNQKIAAYLEAGVRMVLKADPRRRTITVYEQGKPPRRLTEADEFDGGDVLPGFRVAVADLFR